jgi:hypothetical protein
MPSSRDYAIAVSAWRQNFVTCAVRDQLDGRETEVGQLQEITIGPRAVVASVEYENGVCLISSILRTKNHRRALFLIVSCAQKNPVCHTRVYPK